MAFYLPDRADPLSIDELLPEDLQNSTTSKLRDLAREHLVLISDCWDITYEEIPLVNIWNRGDGEFVKIDGNLRRMEVNGAAKREDLDKFHLQAIAGGITWFRYDKHRYQIGKSYAPALEISPEKT